MTYLTLLGVSAPLIPTIINHATLDAKRKLVTPKLPHVISFQLLQSLRIFSPIPVAKTYKCMASPTTVNYTPKGEATSQHKQQPPRDREGEGVRVPVYDREDSKRDHGKKKQKNGIQVDEKIRFLGVEKS